MPRKVTGPPRRRLLTTGKGFRLWVVERHPYPPGTYRPEPFGLSWRSSRLFVLKPKSLNRG